MEKSKGGKLKIVKKKFLALHQKQMDSPTSICVMQCISLYIFDAMRNQTSNKKYQKKIKCSSKEHVT